jgi:hypothetical protein
MRRPDRDGYRAGHLRRCQPRPLRHSPGRLSKPYGRCFFPPELSSLDRFPRREGLVVANGEDGTFETGWESQKLLPIWINESAGIVSPVRLSRPSTFFRDCREGVHSNLPNLYHINSRRRVVWFRQVYETEI